MDGGSAVSGFLMDGSMEVFPIVLDGWRTRADCLAGWLITNVWLARWLATNGVYCLAGWLIVIVWLAG